VHGHDRALKQYFAQKVLELVNQEMTQLAGDDLLKAGEHTALTWAKVTSFSFTGIQTMVKEKAPLLWSVLTMAAIGPNVTRLAKAREEAIEGARGRGSNNRRDPWLVCASDNILTYRNLILDWLGLYYRHSDFDLFPIRQIQHAANSTWKHTFHNQRSSITSLYVGTYGSCHIVQ
jgi:hypothetical protein